MLRPALRLNSSDGSPMLIKDAICEAIEKKKLI